MADMPKWRGADSYSRYLAEACLTATGQKPWLGADFQKGNSIGGNVGTVWR